MDLAVQSDYSLRGEIARQAGLPDKLRIVVELLCNLEKQITILSLHQL
jgi:hypothetical protein